MKAIIFAVIALFTLPLVPFDADAKRLSGGRNMGMQRNAPEQKTAPAQQQQAAPAQQQPQQATPPQQPQPSGASKWLGPLAGFALGAGLAALFLNNGLTGALAGVLLLGLIVAILVFAARALRGRMQGQPMQYAGVPGSEPAPYALPGGAGAQSVAASTEARLPGFDEAGFVRQAKLNFVRLQEAYDAKNLTMVKDVLAPDVYRQVEADSQAEWGADQKTEVLTLEAAVIDAVEESGSYIVSVRFSGMMRDGAGREPEPFTEIWHLQKPTSGRSGWQVAGIQQG